MGETSAWNGFAEERGWMKFPTNNQNICTDEDCKKKKKNFEVNQARYLKL